MTTDRSAQHPVQQFTGKDILSARRFALVAVVATIATQRLALHIGLLPLHVGLFVAGTLVLVAIHRGYAQLQPRRFLLWLGLSVSACFSALLACADARPYSLPSAVAFLSCTAILVLRPAASRDIRQALRQGLFEGLLTVGLTATLLILAQWFTQIAFGYYLDPLSRLPSSLLLAGYNVRAPVSATLTLARPNAVVFLEPSFAAIFVGLAALSAATHSTLPKLARFSLSAILLTGTFLTLSGTGLIVVAIGFLALMRPLSLLRLAFTIGVSITLLLIILKFSPLTHDIINTRLTEVTRPTGSGYARFVNPYKTILTSGFSDTALVLFGNGSGSADSLVADSRQSTGTYQFFSTVLKLYWEYGLVSAILYLLLLFDLSLQVDVDLKSLFLAMLGGYLFLVGGLVSPIMPLIVSLLTFASPPRYAASTPRVKIVTGALIRHWYKD